jgi:VanZ family protein
LRKIQTIILPALLWLIVTTVLLCLPGSAFPKENWFDKIWLDKWIHIGLFATMVFLWCRAAHLSDNPNKKVLIFSQIAVYVFLYGIVMEFVQHYFIPNRSFDLGDIIADGAGSGLGGFLSVRLYIKK